MKLKTLEEKLLDNRLAFLATHRGVISQRDGVLFVESDQPEFKFAILGKEAKVKSIPSSVNLLKLLPWSEATPAELRNIGFAPIAGVSFMSLDPNHSPWKIRDDLQITQVQDAGQMDAFSYVQSRSFNENPESFARLYPWLKAANQRNLHNSHQGFYVGTLAEEPVGVVLTLTDGDIAGIYAVATLPSHRKKRISTTIMKRAVSEALTKGCCTITLQVAQDSPVEEFYRHLGFRRVFSTPMYRRS